MTELSFLNFFLGVAFILAPIMTKNFFLKGSKVYSRVHLISLAVILIAVLSELNYLVIVWPLFCLFGFSLYLKQERAQIFSIKGFATCIPFAFSLISAAWFVAGVNDLQMLGYQINFSFYAALHGGILGWLFVGCLARLANRVNSDKFYLYACYVCLILFLCVAFGIDGVPYIKRIGTIGLSIIVPLSIAKFFLIVRKENSFAPFFAAASFIAVVFTMILALLNQFWVIHPTMIFGVPVMTLSHGFINTFVVAPCFYVGIRKSSYGVEA